MKNKTVLFSIFIVVVIVQLFVPAKMVSDQHNVLKTGKEFKFETTPIDPSDPFRGKYIHLRFKINEFPILNPKDWRRDEEIYVSLVGDINGFAKIKDVIKEKPDETEHFVKAKVDYVNTLSNKISLRIEYPFERFYMKENKAKNAELLHSEVLKDSTKTTYASVFVKNGKSVLNDVLIDGIPIKDLVEAKDSD